MLAGLTGAESDDFFFRMVSPADEDKILHLEAILGQLFHGCFGCMVVCEEGEIDYWPQMTEVG